LEETNIGTPSRILPSLWFIQYLYAPPDLYFIPFPTGGVDKDIGGVFLY